MTGLKPQGGATVWITGLPASGKSTLALALQERLGHEDRRCLRLDGDDLRRGLNVDLGFSARDRDESVRRTAEVARLAAASGLVAICALVSPYAAARDRARERHRASGLAFVEVYLSTPLSECERRDPKGLYAQARAGELPDLTGVGDPYEPPARPELVLPGDEPVARAVERVLTALRSA